MGLTIINNFIMVRLVFYGFDNCRHGARDYEDDTEKFLSDIEKGKKYSVIVAPAFIVNYPEEYKRI